MSTPSYVHGAANVPLLGETIGANLRRTVERHPELDALVVAAQNFRATYREFWDLTTLLARALLARGIARGDRVGIWAPNRYEWVVAQYATARIGAVLVNVNPAYRAHELEYTLNQSGLRLLLHARRFRAADYAAIVGSVRARCPALTETVVLDDEWNALLEEGTGVDDAALAAREASLSFDDPINIQYTSGTTGAPKGATLSHHNILNNGYFCGEILGYTEADRVLVPVPFYHCFGMVIGNLACTTHGACIVAPSESFDPGAALAAVDRERCTSIYGVPTMFIAQLNHADFASTDFSSLRTGVMAGSPCPVEVMKQVRERMNVREITICYGMTETSPVSTQTRVDDPVEKLVGSVGRIHPHVEIKVIEPETGRIVLPCDYGEDPYPVTLGLIEEGRDHLLLRAPIAIDRPIHLLQGMADADVPWRTALAIAERATSERVTVELVKDGDHRLSRERDLARLCAAVDAVAGAGATSINGENA